LGVFTMWMIGRGCVASTKTPSFKTIVGRWIGSPTSAGATVPPYLLIEPKLPFDTLYSVSPTIW